MLDAARSAPVEPAVSDAPSVADILLDLVPTNLFAAFAEGNVPSSSS
jgi:Na+/H+-dicarboxylate symporter